MGCQVIELLACEDCCRVVEIVTGRTCGQARSPRGLVGVVAAGAALRWYDGGVGEGCGGIDGSDGGGCVVLCLCNVGDADDSENCDGCNGDFTEVHSDEVRNWRNPQPRKQITVWNCRGCMADAVAHDHLSCCFSSLERDSLRLFRPFCALVMFLCR